MARELWHARDLLVQLTLRDVRIRYKQAVMGFAWALLMPMLIVVSGTIVRYAMSVSSGAALDVAALGGIAVKALPWAFVVGSVGFATPSLTQNLNLVSKIYFPRQVLPLSSVIAQLFDTCIGAVTLLLVLPFLGATLSPALLWAPVLIVVLVVWTMGIALFLSCANLFFRDVKYIVQVLVMFGIFFTPVLYEPAMLGPVGGPIVMLNPVAPILEGLRLSVIEGWNLALPLTETTASGASVLAWTPWYLVYSAVWAFGGLAGSALLFHRAAFLFAEYV